MKTLLSLLLFFSPVISLYSQDTIPPVITLNGSAYDTIEVYDPYPEPGYSAMDDIDGDLTAQVTVSSLLDTSLLGTYIIEYSVADEAGNTSEKTRWVHVQDTEAPHLELVGDSLKQVALNEQYVDEGYTVSDNYDSIPNVISCGTYRNSSSHGCFTICLMAEDQSGNKSRIITRYISVDNGCTGTLDYAVCETLLNVRPSNVPEIEIYPNPAKDVLIIKNLTQKIKGVSFINLQGQVMAMANVDGNYLKIPDHLSPGVYFIKIELEDQIVVRKQVIE
ncbi:MAG: immunoglobulin-like domain-containing protein [Bacteroidia bacterium]